MNDNRLYNEELFHNERFSGNDAKRKSARKYYSVMDRVKERYLVLVKQYCQGKRLLELGCGSGTMSSKYIILGCNLTGIDISEKGIEKARERIKQQLYNAEFFKMNAEQTDFPNSSFNMVAGLGILHHLDLKAAYREIARLLQEDGHAVFIEPLGHNPFINMYRRLTPGMRTKDEHPLTVWDLREFNKYFINVTIEYHVLFAFIAVPFRNTPFFEKMQAFGVRLDAMLFRIPVMRRFAWAVIIHVDHPK